MKDSGLRLAAAIPSSFVLLAKNYHAHRDGILFIDRCCGRNKFPWSIKEATGEKASGRHFNTVECITCTNTATKARDKFQKWRTDYVPGMYYNSSNSANSTPALSQTDGQNWITKNSGEYVCVASYYYVYSASHH